MNDPFDLDRFVIAQQDDYETALAEIEAGRKRSHWMWYIFPRVAGLGLSEMSRRFAIKSLNEARAYLDHPILGPRLRACAEALLAIEGRSAHEIFGSPDDMKFGSCMTLFSLVPDAPPYFKEAIDHLLGGIPDAATIALLGSE